MNAPLFDAVRELTRDAALDAGFTLRIRGGCMTPVFADGASVEVRARTFYLPGDVVVFRTNAGDLAAHRLLGWRRRALVTKGDGCELHDAPVSHAQILGAVTVPVPLRDRLRALGQYARIVWARLRR
jgi:hypothetical protein